MPVDFEPLSDHWRQDPYPVYRELRDRAPVHFAPASDQFVVSRFEDVRDALSASDTFSAQMDRRLRPSAVDGSGPSELAARTVWRMRSSPAGGRRARFLISEDGESHAALRAIVNRGFTPRRIALWEKRAQELAAEGVERLRSGGRFDLVADLASPLPLTLIAEMIGIESDRMHDFKQWCTVIVAGGTGAGGEADGGRAMIGAMGELRKYLRPIIRARRAEPTDDLISTLVTTESDADLNDLEVFLFLFLLLLAGNETTTNLLGNTVDALLRHSEQLAKVQADPSLIPALVEESLRWDTPVQVVPRQAVEDVVLHGVRIPKGAPVSLLLGSANRDERQFPDPDRFDVEREDKAHLAFGFGPHFCLGASLARMEAKAALEVLLPELSRYERARPEREFLDSFVFRGLRRLDLRPVS